MIIKREEWYKPMQIAEAGWITTPGTKEVNSIYIFILKEIKSGNLKSRNYARGKSERQFFSIKGEWILEYIENMNQ